MDRDELVMRYLLEHYDFGDIGDFQWQIWRDFDPKFAADACDGKAPTQTWHCYVRIKNRKERVKVSVFGCLCCHDDGTTGFEWRGAH